MMRAGETFEEYQARLGTPVEAIEFALGLDDCFDAHEFLKAWQYGDDLSEWPDYRPAPLARRQVEPPPVLYVLSATVLLLMAWLTFDAFYGGGHPIAALIIALLLAMPAALLLHAGGIKAPNTK